MREITRGFFEKADKLFLQMSEEQIKELAKTADPSYKIICEIGGHHPYKDDNETKCARCGSVLEEVK